LSSIAGGEKRIEKGGEEMKHKAYITALLLLVLIATPLWAAQDVKPDASSGAVATPLAGPDYIIGPGDLLEINVWRDDALSKVVTVLPDGKIFFPLIGQFVAAGKTVAQLKQEIEEKVLPFVPEPVLLVDVKQVNSMIIYVIGRVNTPRNFVLNTHVNVLQALSMAGGLNPFAKRDKIKVFREEGGKTKVFNFKYDDVVDGIHLEQNIQLKRGDVVVVP
jgi:polysaccharide biosynthesis/export protein